MAFRVDLSDDEVHTTASFENHISQEGGKRRVHALLTVANGDAPWQGPWLLSEAGLRRLARAATCMADEVAATELALAKVTP